MEKVVYEPNFNTAYRILISQEDKWVPLFWFDFHKDASLYLGISQKANELLVNENLTQDKGVLKVKYADARPVKISDYVNPTKTSFHGSGVINSLNNRSYREAIINTKERKLISILMFKDPKLQRRIISTNDIRSTDICLNYPVNRKAPLVAGVYVEPSSNVHPLIMPDAQYQINLAFRYANASSQKSDTTVLISLSHGTEGVWPKSNIILYPTLSDPRA